MALLEQPTNVNQPLNQVVQEFKLPTETESDNKEVSQEDLALNLVIQDTARAEKFVMSRLWMSEWRIAKALYEAAVKQEFWRDTQVPRASNAYPLVAQHVRAILDQTMASLFPENPPFGIEPNAGTPRQASRAWEPVITYQLRQTSFKQQLRLVAKDGEIFGTGIGKWGWEKFPLKKLIYRRAKKPAAIPSQVGSDVMVHTQESDDLEEVEFITTVSRPFFVRCEINHILVSPGLRFPDIRKAGYVIHRDYLTIRDLNKLRDFEGWMIPPEKELKLLAAPPTEQAVSSVVEAETTAFPAQGHRALPRYIDESENPLDHKLEVLERWSKDTVMVALQRKKIIRNENNEFGEIPFVNCYWDDIPGAFYAFGIPRRIGGIQTHIQGLRNLRMDDVNLNLQNVWLEKQGTNLTGQPMKLYPGARHKVTDPEGVKSLMKQPILGEAYREEGVLIADAEKTTGANDLLVQGATPDRGRTSMGRTAQGANLMGGASGARIQSYVDVIIEQVFLPVLYSFLHMNRRFLDPKLLRRLVGAELFNALQQEYGGDLLIDMCNSADVEFTMVAGTNMAARRNMAASLPLEMNMYMAPAVQQALASSNKQVNWVEMSRRMEQASGWKSPNDIIIDMTPQQVQQRAMSNPEVIKAKATQDRINQLHRNNMELSAQEHQQKIAETDAKGLANAGQEAVTRVIERALTREEGDELIGAFQGA